MLILILPNNMANAASIITLNGATATDLKFSATLQIGERHIIHGQWQPTYSQYLIMLREHQHETTPVGPSLPCKLEIRTLNQRMTLEIIMH